MYTWLNNALYRFAVFKFHINRSILHIFLPMLWVKLYSFIFILALKMYLFLFIHYTVGWQYSLISGFAITNNVTRSIYNKVILANMNRNFFQVGISRSRIIGSLVGWSLSILLKLKHFEKLKGTLLTNMLRKQG